MEFKFRGLLTDLLDRLEPKPVVRLKHIEGTQPSPYRAVSVRAGTESCQAARQFGSLRFFPSKAPRFPLPECTCTKCDCSYVHHADRRRGFDRRKTIDRNRLAANVERRLRSGRRSTDAAGFNDPAASH